MIGSFIYSTHFGETSHQKEIPPLLFPVSGGKFAQVEQTRYNVGVFRFDLRPSRRLYCPTRIPSDTNAGFLRSGAPDYYWPRVRSPVSSRSPPDLPQNPLTWFILYRSSNAK